MSKYCVVTFETTQPTLPEERLLLAGFFATGMGDSILVTRFIPVEDLPGNGETIASIEVARQIIESLPGFVSHGAGWDIYKGSVYEGKILRRVD